MAFILTQMTQDYATFATGGVIPQNRLSLYLLPAWKQCLPTVYILFPALRVLCISHLLRIDRCAGYQSLIAVVDNGLACFRHHHLAYKCRVGRLNSYAQPWR